MKKVLLTALGCALIMGAYIYFTHQKVNLGTVLTTNTTDTLETFRTNVNTSLANLNSAVAGFLGTTTPWTVGQVAYVSSNSAVTSVATSTITVDSPLSTSGTAGYQVGGSSYHIGLGTVGIANGGTATTTMYTGGVLFYNGSLATVSQAGDGIGLFWDETNKRLGFGTSTPFGILSINPSAGGTNAAFIVGSSTATLFAVNRSGQIQTGSVQPATTTSMQLDWSNTPQQVEYRIGTSATTISIINATTTALYGSRKLVWVCNPGSSAGALTWKGVEWIGGSVPSQTTTANQCDIYSFDITEATSSSAFKVAGSAGTGFQ